MRSPREMLADAVTIAVVGASRYPEKAAHSVPHQLLKHGWRIIPVNPNVEEIFGERCYPVLAEIPEPVDMVVVFRPSADATDVVRQAIEIGTKAVWLQQGIVSPQGRKMAEAAGIDYTEDQCTAVVRAAYGLTRRAS